MYLLSLQLSKELSDDEQQELAGLTANLRDELLHAIKDVDAWMNKNERMTPESLELYRAVEAVSQFVQVSRHQLGAHAQGSLAAGTAATFLRSLFTLFLFLLFLCWWFSRRQARQDKQFLQPVKLVFNALWLIKRNILRQLMEAMHLEDIKKKVLAYRVEELIGEGKIGFLVRHASFDPAKLQSISLSVS